MWQPIFGAVILLLVAGTSWMFVIAPPDFIEERHDSFMLFASVMSALASFVTAAAIMFGVNEITKRNKDD